MMIIKNIFFGIMFFLALKVEKKFIQNCSDKDMCPKYQHNPANNINNIPSNISIRFKEALSMPFKLSSSFSLH